MGAKEGDGGSLFWRQQGWHPIRLPWANRKWDSASAFNILQREGDVPVRPQWDGDGKHPSRLPGQRPLGGDCRAVVYHLGLGQRAHAQEDIRNGVHYLTSSVFSLSVARSLVEGQALTNRDSAVSDWPSPEGFPPTPPKLPLLSLPSRWSHCQIASWARNFNQSHTVFVRVCVCVSACDSKETRTGEDQVTRKTKIFWNPFVQFPNCFLEQERCTICTLGQSLLLQLQWERIEVMCKVMYLSCAPQMINQVKL